jgi:multicomponent Na+:H+ antiporter subunit G
MIHAVLDILTIVSLLFGLFFMFVGALGVWRLPDVYNRMHAGSKCVTLGISGLLIAAVLHFSSVYGTSGPGGAEMEWKTLLGAVTKAVLVVIFQYTAAPVGSHMLARAAHLDRAEKFEGTLGDDLQTDRPASIRAKAS